MALIAGCPDNKSDPLDMNQTGRDDEDMPAIVADEILPSGLIVAAQVGDDVVPETYADESVAYKVKDRRVAKR
jgi:hypothetical protein